MEKTAVTFLLFPGYGPWALGFKTMLLFNPDLKGQKNGILNL